jgi:putative protease
MELILNINQYDYRDFLHANVNTLQIGLTDFCVGYLKTYTLEELETIANAIHQKNKKVYLAINIIANESLIQRLNEIMPHIKDLNIDGYVVSDFGILQLLKEYELTDKIIFNPVTNITNKYSASIANGLGINHCCLANELNIGNILEIATYCNGNVEILAQGYYQICNSKRALLSNFFKKHRIKNTSDYYYIKEESRDYSYPIIELNEATLVYIDRQRTALPYLKEIIDSNIKYLRIDSMFLSKQEIHKHIENYTSVINDVTKLDKHLEILKSYSNSNLKSLDNISILTKEKKND